MPVSRNGVVNFLPDLSLRFVKRVLVGLGLGRDLVNIEDQEI